MTFFRAAQLRRVRVLNNGRAGGVVTIPDLFYRGRVIAPADADAAWVAARLELLAAKLGFAVVRGRLASPVDLTEA